MKLRTILFALSLLVVLSASIGGYLYYSTLREFLFKEAERQSLLDAEHAKIQIISLLFENLKTVEALAGLPELRIAIQKPDRIKIGEVNDLLMHFKQALKIDVCYLINRQGMVIASSNHDSPTHWIGRHYGSKPYFKKAVKGEMAVSMVLGATSKQREMYYAYPVYSARKVIGVIALKASIYSIENRFQDSRTSIWALRDRAGLVLASNQANWLYRIIKHRPIPEKKEPGSEIWMSETPQDWILLNESNGQPQVDYAGHSYLKHTLMIDPDLGWELVYLTSLEDVFNKVSNPILRNTGKIILLLCLLIVWSVIFLYREANHDLKQRKRAEEQLKQVKEFNENIVQSITEGIILEDDQGVFTFINQAATRILGFPTGDLIGKHWKTIVTPDQQKIVEASRQRRLRGESDRYEVQLLRKDGKSIQVLVSGRPLFDRGHFAGTLAVLTDISERKKAEEEIKKLSSAMEQSIDGIAISDMEMRLVYVNEAFARMHAYAPEAMIGLRCSDLQPKRPETEPNDVFQQVFASGSWTGEQECLRKDQSPFPTYISFNLLKDDEGQAQGVLAVVRDISRQKKMEIQLQQMQKLEAIGTLAGGIAHNFNNLLMGIQGNASLMLLEMKPKHPHYKMLTSIEKLVQAGAKLTGQLLGYAREGRYEVKPLNLNQIIKETAETFGMAKKEIKVYLELARELHGTMADQGQIEQVLLNLYVNASDAMPGGGELFIETRNVTDQELAGKEYKIKAGHYIMILVRDTGVGMDKNTLERIFDPFFTTKGMGSGTGLGLASVYGIVKAHGGYIDVQSEKGQGTVFRIYLPASVAETTEEKKIRPVIVKGTESILIVDDEEQVLEVGVLMLKELGYQVLAAKSGHEALQILRAKPKSIALVILDMIMPDMSGGETFDRLKRIKPDLRVLLCSGYSIDGRAAEILQRGCDGFIQKPFDLTMLSDKLREILDQGTSSA